MYKYFILFFICAISFKIDALENEKLSCIILLNRENIDNVGNTSSFYLMSKLQSALAEQSTPILVSTSLWNAFIERCVSFEQNANRQNTKESKLLTLHKKIKERFIHWTNYYNQTSDDLAQNKALVVQRINQEFYDIKDRVDISDAEYQLLLNFLTTFIPKDWCIYKKFGFHLFIPKRYLDLHSSTGFNLNALEEVFFCQDIVSNYFDLKDSYSLVKALPEFFLRYTDLPNQKMPYAWNIVVSGHGGSIYKEKNRNNIVTWHGEPLMADLTVQEFKDLLSFFQTQIKTHMLFYSGCYSGGNHIELAFGNGSKQTYNFAIICDCLTDCSSYCKWNNKLPSWQQKFLTVDDVYYDSAKKSWDLIMKSPYNWNEFFNSISKIDFTIESIDQLHKTLSYISYPVLANIPLLRRPGMDSFYPVTSPGVFKIDDQFIKTENENKEDAHIILHGVTALLIGSEYINSDLVINNRQNTRIISIKPGHSVHYIKKIEMVNKIDLPSVFWQAEFQIYNKTFLVDECQFYHDNLPIFQDTPNVENNVIIKNVMIVQENHLIRLFFTVDDSAVMVVANKLTHHELDKNADIQETIILSPQAKQTYEELYISLRNSISKSSSSNSMASGL